MSGFEKQTYTQVPNSLFEVMSDMDECELKVVLYICRYTFGYHRDEIKISTRKLAKAINMSIASVDKGADAAVQRGLIERITDGQNTTLWRAVVSDSENESPSGDTENETGVTQKMNHVDSNNESQVGVKERVKKELKKVKEGASATPAEVKLYREVTKKFPPSPNFEDVVKHIQDVGARLGRAVTVDDLRPFYKAWTSCGWNQFSINWLEYAVKGTMPTAKTFSRNAPQSFTPAPRVATQEELAHDRAIAAELMQRVGA